MAGRGAPILDGDLRRARDGILDNMDAHDERRAQQEAALAAAPPRQQTGMTIDEIVDGKHDHIPLGTLVEKVDRAIAVAREKHPHVVLELVQKREQLIRRRSSAGNVETRQSVIATIERASKAGHVRVNLTPQQAFDLLGELEQTVRTTMKSEDGVVVADQYLHALTHGEASSFVENTIQELLGVKLTVQPPQPEESAA